MKFLLYLLLILGALFFNSKEVAGQLQVSNLNFVSCPGETVLLDVQITGGAGNFEYNWSGHPSISDPTAAQPTVQIDSDVQINLLVSENGGTVTEAIVFVDYVPLHEEFSFTSCSGVYHLSVEDYLPEVETGTWSLNGESQISASFSGSVSDGVPDEVFLIKTGICSEPVSRTIHVDYESQCVWPGDANYDGIVNASDLLAIGVAHGETGPARPQGSANWNAQPIADWALEYETIEDIEWGIPGETYNAKHFDCNGDGIIDVADLEVIKLNYQEDFGRRDPIIIGVPLLAVGDPDYAPGEISFPIFLLPSEYEPLEAYGVSMRLSYGSSALPSWINRDNIYFEWDYAFWLFQGDNPIELYYHYENERIVELAISRTNKINKTGEGIIGRWVFPHDGELSKYSYYPWLHEGSVIQNDMTPQSFWIENRIGVQNQDWASPARIYPNPAQGSITIERLDGELLGDYQIWNQIGKLALTGSSSEFIQKIDVSTLAPGLYYLHGEKIVQSFLIAH